VHDPADEATDLVPVATATDTVATLTRTGLDRPGHEQEVTPMSKVEQDEKVSQETTIIVNGQEKTVTEKEISFDEVVALAFNPVPKGPYILITVAYRRGHGDKPQGTLTEGQSVKVKKGMIFDVTATDRS
jgi:hypothetical protein